MFDETDSRSKGATATAKKPMHLLKNVSVVTLFLISIAFVACDKEDGEGGEEAEPAASQAGEPAASEEGAEEAAQEQPQPSEAGDEAGGDHTCAELQACCEAVSGLTGRNDEMTLLIESTVQGCQSTVRMGADQICNNSWQPVVRSARNYAGSVPDACQ